MTYRKLMGCSADAIVDLTERYGYAPDDTAYVLLGHIKVIADRHVRLKCVPEAARWQFAQICKAIEV